MHQLRQTMPDSLANTNTTGELSYWLTFEVNKYIIITLLIILFDCNLRGTWLYKLLKGSDS